MDTLSPGVIAAIAAAVVVVAVIRWFISSPKLPPQRIFKCSRCSRVSPHSDRTVEAWRRGTKSLFCDSCHRLWLSAQPRQTDSPQLSPSRAFGSSRNRGCLGVTLVLVAVPLAFLFMAIYA